MRWMRILTEQECFKARSNEVMKTEFARRKKVPVGLVRAGVRKCTSAIV